MHHEAKGSTHVVKTTNNLLNKDSFPTTSAQEDSSIEAPAPKMLLSSSSTITPTYDPLTWAIDAWTIGFNTSKKSLVEELLILHHIQ
jgi:hypothetical protein